MQFAINEKNWVGSHDLMAFAYKQMPEPFEIYDKIPMKIDFSCDLGQFFCHFWLSTSSTYRG